MAMVNIQLGGSAAVAAEPQPSVGELPVKTAGGAILDPVGIEVTPATKVIRVTEKALKRIRTAMTKEDVSPEQGGLRVGILGGGCSGLSYSIRFDSQPRERDRVYRFGPEGEEVRIFVDPKSFLYLAGMILDYEETLMRQGFNFINPNSTKSCGCGSSFSS